MQVKYVTERQIDNVTYPQCTKHETNYSMKYVMAF